MKLLLLSCLLVLMIPLLATGQSPDELAQNADWTPYEEELEGVAMVLVPAGCFMMGGSEAEIEPLVASGLDHFADELPQHEYCFNEPFWIDKYEVSNAQFEAFEGQAEAPSHWAEANYPRDTVTWAEARDFCAKRGARLPTEAEWEYAARGVDGWAYTWGNEFDGELVVWAENSEDTGGLSEVGSRPEGASWVGAMDLLGNISELLNTIYGVYDLDNNEFTQLFEYPYDAKDGREETDTDETIFRVLRGGAYFNYTLSLGASGREWISPLNARMEIGFRCARSYE